MAKSSSKTQSTNSTATADNRVAADGGAIVLSGGAKLETLSDDVAISAIEAGQAQTATGAALAARVNADSLDAVGLAAGRALETVKEVNADSLDFGRSALASNVKVTETTLDAVRESASSNAALADSLATLAARNAAPDAQNTAELVKVGGAVLAVAAIAFAVTR